jgi:sugar-specific transcriptional regulator TrmB
MYLLEPVGLGRLENDIYLALLDLKRATAEELAQSIGCSPAELRPALRGLLDHGLVQQLGFIPALYAIVAPDEALPALISRRRGDLARMQMHVEELADRLRARPAREGKPVVELLEGEDAVLAAVSRLQLEAREEIISNCADSRTASPTGSSTPARHWHHPSTWRPCAAAPRPANRPGSCRTSP